MTRDEIIKGLENEISRIHREPKGKMLGIFMTVDEAEEIVAMLKEQAAEDGAWITIWREDDPDTSTHARCSICNRISERPTGGYCKWCGAKMSQEWGVDG